MRTLILIFCSLSIPAFAKPEVSVASTETSKANTQTASNSAIECLAHLTDILHQRDEMLGNGGPDKTDVDVAVMNRFVRICRHSSHVLAQLEERMSRAGYVHPRDVIRQAARSSDPDLYIKKNFSRLNYDDLQEIKTAFGEATEVVSATAKSPATSKTASAAATAD